MNRLIIRIVLAAMLVGPATASGARAQDYGEQFAPSQTSGMVGEATKAVVDRVFGVKGEAEDIKYHAIELSNHSPVNAGLRSALLPGWGQWFNRQPVKAAALFMVVTVGLYGTASTYDRSNDDYDTYRSLGNRNDPTYDDYKRRQTQALIMGGATAALWAYSIWDAYHHAYNPLWSREPSVQLALTDSGAAVEWRRRF